MSLIIIIKCGINSSSVTTLITPYRFVCTDVDFVNKKLIRCVMGMDQERGPQRLLGSCFCLGREALAAVFKLPC